MRSMRESEETKPWVELCRCDTSHGAVGRSETERFIPSCSSRRLGGHLTPPNDHSELTKNLTQLDSSCRKFVAVQCKISFCHITMARRKVFLPLIHLVSC
jgi:hypothetical protein